MIKGPLKNCCLVYLITINGTTISDADYKGFGSSETRILEHVVTSKVFFQFNFSCTGHFEKYEKWSKIIKQNGVLRIYFVSENNLAPEALYKETLLIRTKCNEESSNLAQKGLHILSCIYIIP